MTHPFHPLRGREFEFIQSRSCWGIERVDYLDEDGTLRNLPMAWTSVAAEEPFVRVAGGRSAFRVSDLLAPGSLLDSLDGDGSAGREGDGGARTVKEILPLVYQRGFLVMG